MAPHILLAGCFALDSQQLRLCSTLFLRVSICPVMNLMILSLTKGVLVHVLETSLCYVCADYSCSPCVGNRLKTLELVLLLNLPKAAVILAACGQFSTTLYLPFNFCIIFFCIRTLNSICFCYDVVWFTQAAKLAYLSMIVQGIG